MALVVKNLENAFKKVFSDMKEAGENATDEDFSEGISKAVKDYIDAGNITTVDAGTVSSGVFAGAGTGSTTSKDSLMDNVVLPATVTMKQMTSGGDNILATAIFNGLKALHQASEVNTDITGTTTSPQGSPVPPTSGKGKGTGLTCIDSGFVDSVNQIFSDMNTRKDEEGFDGDAYLAEQLAIVTNKYIATGTVTTSGQGALTGVTGNGKIA